MAKLKPDITPEEERKQNLEQLANYRPLDDDFMRELFRNDLDLAQFVLRIIIDKPDLTLIKEESQYDLQHLFGEPSICLDVFGVDSEGQQYDFEVQRQDKGATPKRARYYSSAMDVDNLKEKQKFDALPNTYVIFITENDVLGGGLPIYHVNRTIEEMNHKSFGDRGHIIYVNGADQNASTELGKLMHDFFCTKADDMNYNVLAEKVRYFKENEEGVKHMSKSLRI